MRVGLEIESCLRVLLFRAKYLVKSFQEFAGNVFSRDPDMHFVTSF